MTIFCPDVGRTGAGPRRGPSYPRRGFPGAGVVPPDGAGGNGSPCKRQAALEGPARSW